MGEQGSLRVDLAHLLTFGARVGEELLDQAGLPQGEPAVLGAEVEAAALVAGVRAGVALARFVLQVPTVVRGRAEPEGAVAQVFAIIANGWREPSRS